MTQKNSCHFPQATPVHQGWKAMQMLPVSFLKHPGVGVHCSPEPQWVTRARTGVRTSSEKQGDFAGLSDQWPDIFSIFLVQAGTLLNQQVKTSSIHGKTVCTRTPSKRCPHCKVPIHEDYVLKGNIFETLIQKFATSSCADQCLSCPHVNWTVGLILSL